MHAGDVCVCIVCVFMYACMHVHVRMYIIMIIIIIIIWDSVQLNHPYGTFSKFPEQAKEK